MRLKGISGYLFAALMIVTVLPALLWAKEPVGVITGFYGQAWIERVDYSQIRAALGIQVFEGDLLATGESGKLKVMFSDDQVITLGPQTQYRIEIHQFAQDQGIRKTLGRLISGFLRVVVSKILGAQSSVEIETPTAVAGVQGTFFLIEAGLDYTTFIALDGRIMVRGKGKPAATAMPVDANQQIIVDYSRKPRPPTVLDPDLLKKLFDATSLEPVQDLSEAVGHSSNLLDIPINDIINVDDLAAMESDVAPPEPWANLDATALDFMKYFDLPHHNPIDQNDTGTVSGEILRNQSPTNNKVDITVTLNSPKKGSRRPAR